MEDHARVADLWRLRPYVAPSLRRGLLGTLYLVCAAAVALPQPLLSRYLIDNVIIRARLIELGWILPTLVLLILISAALNYFGRVQLVRFQQHVLIRLQSALVERILELPLPFLTSQRTGHLMARVTKDTAYLQTLFSAGVVELVSSVFTLLGGMVMLALLSPKLTLLAVAGLPFYLLLAVRSSKGVRSSALASLKAAGLLSHRLKEAFSRIGIVRLFNAERARQDEVTEALNVAADALVQQQAATASTVAGMTAIIGVASVIVFGVGAHDVVQGQLTLGSLVAFNTYLLFLYRPVMSLASFHMLLQPVLVALTRILSLLDELPESDEQAAVAVSLNASVRYDNVTLIYPDGRCGLNGVTFDLQPGERLVLVGASGSGKSSVVSLLTGFYAPTSGSITISGVPINAVAKKNLRSQMAVVPQDPGLWDGSLRTNVAFGATDVSEDLVTRATELAGLSTLIKRLPAGLNTQVGEGGLQLSGGERQRVAIARALMRPASLMVLDEATAALDPPTERLLLNELKEWGAQKTFLVATQRVSVAEWGTRILFLTEGRVAATGEHSQLLKSYAPYRAFWQDVEQFRIAVGLDQSVENQKLIAYAQSNDRTLR